MQYKLTVSRTSLVRLAKAILFSHSVSTAPSHHGVTQISYMFFFFPVCKMASAGLRSRGSPVREDLKKMLLVNNAVAYVSSVSSPWWVGIVKTRC